MTADRGEYERALDAVGAAQDGRRRALAERDAARAEADRRKVAMNDAKDALACGDGDAAYDALTRHEATGGSESLVSGTPRHRSYRKKPVVIEAVRWTGRNQTEIYDFTRAEARFSGNPRDGFTLTIHTLEGVMRADVGDWIIRGVQGEFYPCKPDIFEATYEAVDE